MKDKMTLEEMKKERDRLSREIEIEETRADRENYVIEKINSMTDEQKDFLLSLIDHDETSYSEEIPCRLCMLEEILKGEHGGKYDFDITVDIYKT